MKKSILNLLRGGVFALAAVAAFAFTQPLKVTTAFGAVRVDGIVVDWHPVDISNPQNYVCDEEVIVGCIYAEETESSLMLIQGEFKL